MMNSAVLLCSALLVGSSWGADILHLSMIASPSHHIWEKTLMTALHQRGHRLTVLTHSLEKNKENLTFINLENVYEKLHSDFDLETLVNDSTYTMVTILFEWLTSICTWDLETEGLKTIIQMAKSGKKFDLIIIDMMASACALPLVEMFGYPPVVGTCPFGIPQYFTFAFGTDVQSSYIPMYALTYSDKMNFVERSTNYFYVNILNFMYKYTYLPSISKLWEKVDGKKYKLAEMEKNVSIALVNYDHVLNYPRSLPPNVIPVGGMHTKRAKELPQELKKILDESKNGVILFSMGTNIRSDKLNSEKLQAILNAFSRLKETVLWKYESSLDNLPKNVIIRKWLPQNDIQAHPNVKLFITHAGGLSSQEAMYHALPVVGIPFFADQRENMARMEARKLGKTLEFSTITADGLYAAVREVIDNPIYKKNADKLSRRYRDQPMNPLDRAVFWVEYVLRHGGAEHLSAASKNLKFYQILHLDLWALIIIVIVAIYFLFIRMFCKVKLRPAKLKTH